MSQGRKKHGPTGTRTKGLSFTVRILCQLRYRATWLFFDGKLEALGSSPGRTTIFFLPCDIWWLSVGSRLGQRASRSACVVFPPSFRADSGTILIKQGGNVKGRLSGSVAQLAECSHGNRDALGSSSGQAKIFLPYDTYVVTPH